MARVYLNIMPQSSAADSSVSDVWSNLVPALVIGGAAALVVNWASYGSSSSDSSSDYTFDWGNSYYGKSYEEQSMDRMMVGCFWDEVLLPHLRALLILASGSGRQARGRDPPFTGSADDVVDRQIALICASPLAAELRCAGSAARAHSPDTRRSRRDTCSPHALDARPEAAAGSRRPLGSKSFPHPLADPTCAGKVDDIGLQSDSGAVHVHVHGIEYATDIRGLFALRQHGRRDRRRSPRTIVSATSTPGVSARRTSTRVRSRSTRAACRYSSSRCAYCRRCADQNARAGARGRRRRACGALGDDRRPRPNSQRPIVLTGVHRDTVGAGSWALGVDPISVTIFRTVVVRRIAIDGVDVVDAALRRVLDDERRSLDAEVRRTPFVVGPLHAK